MTDPSTRLLTSTFWIVAALNTLAVLVNLGLREFNAAGLMGVVVGWLFLVRAGLERLERWSAACVREAEAKAQFAEHLLTRLREGQGVTVDLGVGEQPSGGTKH